MAHIPREDRGDAEKFFLRMMVDEIEKGYAPGSTFRLESQLSVNRKFRILFGPIFSDRYLKSRLKNLRKRHKEFSELLNREGIMWNMQLNAVYGNDKLLKEEYKVCLFNS